MNFKNITKSKINSTSVKFFLDKNVGFLKNL